MAKKGVNRIAIAGLGIGVLIAVIVPVLFVVLGFDPSNIVQQVSDTDEFEIPFPLPPEEEVIILTDEELNDYLVDPSLDPNVGNTVTEDEIMAVDDAINKTVTSNDPPLTQIGDELDLPTTTKIVNLETFVVKIDSFGNRSNQTISNELTPLALFVEEDTDADFRTGRIEYELTLVTDPNTIVIADGLFNINISNNEIIQTDVEIRASGVTDQEGRITVNFISPTGFSSPNFTFDFDTFFGAFPNEEITTVEFIIKSIEITLDRDQKFGLSSNQASFSMDIFRDDIQIFIEDTEGNVIRSYPQDDRILVKTSASTLTCVYRTTAPACCGKTCLIGSGCGRVTLCSRCSVPAPSTCARFVAPSISVSLFDENGLIAKNSGSGVLIDELVFRNANYTIDHNVVGFQDPVLINAPKSQKNYGYSCWITDTLVWSGGGMYHTSPSGNSFLTCNFPK